MSNLIVNPEHPRVAVVNDVRAIGAMCHICGCLSNASAIGLRIGADLSMAI
jgi:hypothetical protein